MLKFMFGALLGATVALLLAPKSGEELREDLSDRATDAFERGKGIAQNVSQQARELGSQAREQFS